ncbi:hypothetical protein CERZMDRAFT_121720 [Cercospora zeae-maydis SCOH1-5]|uniref:HECT-type E3 ubiquitin transferase n=1 Tax=Cercospora zeae-maydis SCOH1-5 TaxID=717836 RepID=A0A6A6FC25_9PEZI|nr:hypothetical protein CERZMDRAFT_121720 [Cercospora zeae-maydis SCOH1-5]
MGRIKKTPTQRHMSTLSPFVEEFVQQSIETPLYQLPAKLDGFPQHWPLPRGDLYHWVPLLDRFDHVLELFNKEYGLSQGPQTQQFERRLLQKGDAGEETPYPDIGGQAQQLEAAGYSAEGDRELVESILRFTRLLLEHCGNRSLYASSTHINDLLHTTSLSLLQQCLKLGLRLAQRYQVARYKNHNPAQQALLLANHYNINLDNLHKIAMPFPKPHAHPSSSSQSSGKAKEKPAASLSFVPTDLVAIAKGPMPAAIRNAVSTVSLSYYEQMPAESSQIPASHPSQMPPSTPTPARRASNLGPSRDRPSAGDRSASTDDSSAVPGKQREQENSSPTAPKLFTLPSTEVAQAAAWSLVKESIDKVPADMQYELLNRIRIAKAFASPEVNAQEILEVRLLAVANLVYALSESKLQERIGIPDAEEPRRYHLAQQLSDLLQPATDGQAPLTLQMETTVLMTLEALSKSRNKVSEVGDALAIGVNHGVLYYELRKLISTLSVAPNADKAVELEESKWRDAVFELINSLLQCNAQARYGEKMVAAGVIGILAEALQLRTPRAERFYERTLQFFDSFVHGISTAFQTLADVRGLDIIADLTASEVNTALEKARNGHGLPAEFKSRVVDYDIPFYQQSTLRQLFKNTVHMFEHNTGGHDRLLRNLIDTPQVLGALRSVIENSSIFGANVWSGAVNIISSFIHNEPTSYQVIGEAGLSRSLLESITQKKIPDELPPPGEIVSPKETPSIVADDDGQPIYPSVAGILPVGEVLCDVPTAFGAICLNENGMQLFQASGVLVKYFDIFLSPKHVRGMEDEGQTATTIGHAFDELARHQPRLKGQIMSAVLNMLKRLKELTAILSHSKQAGAKLWEAADGKYIVAGGSAALTAGLGDLATQAGPSEAGAVSSPVAEVVANELSTDEREHAPGVSHLYACFKFLEGFFHNSGMCNLFCEESGAEILLDLATSPSNPHDLVAFPLFSKLSQVLKTMCEAKAPLVLPSMIKRTQRAVAELKRLMSVDDRSSSFSSFLNLSLRSKSSLPEGTNGTAIVKALSETHALTHILGRTLAPPPYTLRHGSQNNHVFLNLNFTDVYIELVDDLIRLHASCLWEGLLLLRDMPDDMHTKTEPHAFHMRRTDAEGYVHYWPERNDQARTAQNAYSLNASDEQKSPAAILSLKNAYTIRFLLCQVPNGIEAFFHSLGQAIVTKRTDAIPKQHAIFVAEHIAQAVIWELSYRRNETHEVAMELKYVCQVLKMVSRVLLRNSYSMETFGTKEALTLVMTKFYAAGGFDKLNEYLDRVMQLLSSQLDKEKIEPPVKDAIAAILGLYSQVARSKCINDASQSGNIIVKSPTQPDYFQPGQFIVEVRHAILPAISKVWRSEHIDKLTKGNVESVVTILRLILKAEGEDRALRRGENASRRVLAHRPGFRLRDIEHLGDLTDAGFDTSLSREALYRCGGNPQQAEAYCRLRQKEPRVPRFPIPEGESTAVASDPSEQGTHSDGQVLAGPVSRGDDAMQDGGDTNVTGVHVGDEGPQALSSDHDMTSEEDFGSLGRIPVEMLRDDGLGSAAAIFGSAQREAVAQLQASAFALPGTDTQQPFVTVEDLNEEREKVRADLIDQCLNVLGTQDGITFELADLIHAAVAKAGEGANPRAEIGTTLVSSLISLQGEEGSVEAGKKIHAYAHLVALILQDRDFFDSTLDELKDYFPSLVSWVQLETDQKVEDAPWVEMILLIIERVLAEDEQPIEIEWAPPPPDNPLKPLPKITEPEPVVSSELRAKLFNALEGLLPKVHKNKSLALSVCRILVELTRHRDLAARLSTKQTIGKLFVMIRQLGGPLEDKLQATFLMILRHMVEDDETIRQIMRAEIRVAFDNHRSARLMDTSSYTRNLYYLAIRDPQAFVDVTQELLEIKYDGNPHRAQHLILKKSEAAQNASTSPSATASGPKASESVPEDPIPAESKLPSVEGTDGVVHFLLRELFTWKEVADPSPGREAVPETSSDEDRAADVEMADVLPAIANFTAASKPADAKNERPQFKPEDHPTYIYRCFLLQCLAELVACYNCSKLEFINFNPKSSVQSATPSKPRSGTLNYLLNGLLPVGTLEHREDVAHRKKAATSNWAMNVLVSLCTKTQERQSSSVPSFDSVDFAEQEPELTQVRKFVLEHALRAFREATASSEPLDHRYSRLLSLGELFNRMLNGKVDLQRSNVVAAGSFSAHQQIGRLMYEKNFISALTSAIAELDLNFPNAKRAVKYILAPLKQLTELGVTLSQSSDISSNITGGSTEEEEILSTTSVSDEDEGREQTPDLLRNTTLGEDDDDSDDEDDDDDGMDYDEYDEEMDYEEEEMAEHGDVVSDEDEDDMDGIGEIEGRPGDIEIDLDVMEEDDDEDDNSDDSDESSESDDDDMDHGDGMDYSHMEEVTGDDENASLGEQDDGDWEEEGLAFEHHDIVVDGGSPHGGPLEHIGHVLAGDDASEPGDHGHIVRIDMGDGEEEFFEDEMPPEDDDDDEGDAGDYVEDIVYEPEIEDDEDEEAEGGWAWNAQPAPAVLRGVPHHHHHHAHLHRGGFNEMLGMINDPLRPIGIRSHRSTLNARDEDGINPLLQRDSANQRERDAVDLNSDRPAVRRTLLPRVGPDAILQELIATVGPNVAGQGLIMDPGALQSIGRMGPAFTVHTRGGGHAMIDIDPSRPLRDQLGGSTDSRRWAEMLSGGRALERGNGGHEEAQAVEFRACSTANRWQEEARLLFPGKFHEKALRVINMLLRAMVPAAMEVRRIREKEEAERKAAAEKAEEEARKKAEAERAEKEAQEQQEREEREARERAEQEAQARQQAEQAATSGDAAVSMEGVEQAAGGATSESAPAAPEATQPGERVTITIRGRELDITTLGIDREYIEALPEDMREEVIMTQFAEQRSQAVRSGEPQSEISREFLEALPRDIQQELLRSEQMERRRRERNEERERRAQEGGQSNAGPAQPEEMNNADFMAMLDPGLRQAVLLDADESVLAALPDDLQAEARALLGDRRPRADASGRLGRAMEGAAQPSRPRRPVAQMLDKAGIATLLRLMFVSLNHKAKSNLHGILADVCKNTQNRAEVISILLSILQDGTADVSAVERSFAHLSLRAKQPAGPKTPQPLKRSLTGPQTPTPSTDLSPLNIVQQCLGTLNALANENPRVPSFFLNEHETITSQRVTPAKKGKGRESKAGRFPLNALLTLLDRKLITENTAVMETLASLLSHVTHPLTILLKRAKEAEATESTNPTAPAEQSDSTTNALDVPMQEVSAAEHPSVPSAVPPKASTEPKKKRRDLVPPEVPEENIGLVVNILAARECPSKTFSDTLDIIKNLSSIPGAKEVFGKELIRQAQELGEGLLTDLEHLAKQIRAAENGTDLQGMALASFSSAGAKQKKLLRVLVALDHLFDPKRIPQAAGLSDAGVEQKLKDDILSTLYRSPTFEKLWASLSACLAAIRQRGNMVNVATILLPLIESLMVMCRNTALKDNAAIVPSSIDVDVSTPPPDTRVENLFFSFTEEHRKILNELVRNNPKLMNGNLAVLANNSKVLEFDNKRAYFSRKLHDRRAEARVSHPSLQLSVRRDQVFLDSFKSLYYKSGNEIKYGKLNIRFHGEEGIDAGGVSREWFAAMARQMFNPDYALFNPVAADRTTFHPNTLSSVNGEHLLFFKFIGRIIGKALYENRVLDCHFSRAVYRKILGKSVSLKDMETLDLDYYKSLVWILENDITDITFETFSVDIDRFGVTETVDLVENGREIPVTEENKHEYVRHVVEYRLIKSVQAQLDEFLNGFHDIIPNELISIFNEQELELLISGLPDIDVDDWKNNTEYTNYTPTSPQVQWFWRAVRSFDKEEQAKLLQFVTGTSKVPLNGFKELEGMNGFSRFNIHRDYSSKEKLPSSHTCFNQLDLPEYDSYEHLRQQLYTAITAGSEYFGFA